MDVDDISLHILQSVIVLSVNEDRRDPWKKLCDCCSVIRFCLNESFASDLDVQILRAGKTQTASVAIYDAVQAGRDNEAFTLAITVSGIAVLMLYLINRFGRVRW